ncbi:TetR family transcriptional regulator [Komagataeibacter melaceti]|uniref:TetR family transcriptional regulator n=2 Tax=Komagataeibacter melaceti TaxID=2766577 RepID=A0A371YWP9_9PROT|nr:TetR family transcriptional regulator [Komagataeibacter melaceti]
MLVRAGVELLTEKGFSATRVDDVLNATGISKGSFYACFDSKQAFGQILIESYASYFNARIERWLTDGALPPLQRLLNFVHDARAGMQRHAFRRGCLIGNLGHEIDILPESFNIQLCAILQGWEQRVADCLLGAYDAPPTTAQKQLCHRLARHFWIGWEGAVLRARVEHGPQAIDLFATFFFAQAAALMGVAAPEMTETTPPVSPAPPAHARKGPAGA